MRKYTCYVDFTRSPFYNGESPVSDRKYFDGRAEALVWIGQQLENEDWVYSYISITTTLVIIAE